MKKIIPLVLLMVFVFCGTAHALSWAYPFVVWEGRLYEVAEEDPLPQSAIAGPIGRVVTMADDMSGAYYGNASNYYPIGTVYYAIKGRDPAATIAVEAEGEYLRADYRQESMFRFMNLLLDQRILMGIILAIMTLIILFARRKDRRN
ncbi:hypothetical protein [Planomicrobium okeanokoites]|uniref:DUF3592 domain-containing protein n=1 Tax=Planomicrobium okeanokoites TaxID=244 RepID=A0ABV7KQ81_PLAOK|nr:hypothetical protein [Planomicrobium okeanokoites]TAA71057.1 hypothetical protein D2910_01945 [Planomicrobium okeanokoites]